MDDRFIDLRVGYIKKDAIVGIAIADVPANPTHEEIYALYVYIAGIAQPIVVPFDNAEERNNMYNEVKEVL